MLCLSSTAVRASGSTITKSVRGTGLDQAFSSLCFVIVAQLAPLPALSRFLFCGCFAAHSPPPPRNRANIGAYGSLGLQSFCCYGKLGIVRKARMVFDLFRPSRLLSRHLPTPSPKSGFFYGRGSLKLQVLEWTPDAIRRT